MHWLYLIIAMGVIGNIYFVFINFNTAAKIAVTSATVAILLFTSSFLLFSKQHNIRPASHCLTGFVFAFAAFVTLARAYYYLFLNTQANQSLFNVNIIQDLFYLTNTILLIGASFGFILMCNDKYIAEKNQVKLALQTLVSLLNATLESTTDGILVVNLTGKIIQYNTLFTKMWGIPDSIVRTKIDKLLLEFVLDQLVDKDSFLTDVMATYQHIHENTFCELYFKDGRIMERYSRPQYLNGEPVGRVWSFRDVTERKRMEQHLRESEQTLSLLIKKMPLALSLTNERDELIFINDRFQSTFGYILEDIPSIEHWWSLAYPDENYRQQVIATWKTAVENAARLGTDIEPIEYRITCKNGVERVMLVSGIDFSEGHIYIYMDITERKAAEEAIKQLAFYDPLTGLPNRRKLLDRLQYAITFNHRANTQFAVFMMDLDKFKAVNDSLGHAAGDELLKQAAARITRHLRNSDMVARLGGDEFVLVLENLKCLKDAETIALKVIADLTIPFQLTENDSVQIGASIGISLYPQHGSTPEKLIDHADTALYQAKDNGRGCFAYFSETGNGQ